MASPPPPAQYNPITINSPEPGLKVAATVPGEPQINQLFRTVMMHKGSDLHLKSGLPGMMRLRGVIQKMNTPPLTQDTLEKLIYPDHGRQGQKDALKTPAVPTSPTSSATTRPAFV